MIEVSKAEPAKNEASEDPSTTSTTGATAAAGAGAFGATRGTIGWAGVEGMTEVEGAGVAATAGAAFGCRSFVGELNQVEPEETRTFETITTQNSFPSFNPHSKTVFSSARILPVKETTKVEIRQRFFRFLVN